VAGDLRRIDEDSCADNPAHDQHRHIEQTEAAGETSGFGAPVHAAAITSRIE
jgi:hypothetical protein